MGRTRRKNMQTCKEKSEAKITKSLLSLLPYYNCKSLKTAHPPFNSLIDTTSRKSLDNLCSLYDLNLFKLNPGNNLNINPDEKCLGKVLKSKYFSPLTFKKAMSSYIPDSSFSLVHNNIRSLRKNFEDLQNQVLSELTIDFSIIGVTETRIYDSDGLDLIPSLPGYCFESVPTPLSAGGVGFYINNKLRYKIISCISNTSFQALWIEILNPKAKNIICGIVYRQHNNPEAFLEYLSNALEDICCTNKKIFLMGDFNIDLLRYETCSYSQTLIELSQSLSFFPTIDKPTRVYGNSATLIDNIFSNDLDNFLISGNIVTDVSDHFVQFCISTSRYENYYSRPNSQFRDYSKFNANRFIADLHLVDWKAIVSKNEVNTSFSSFYKKLNKIVNKHAPLKKLSRRRLKIISKPWITKGLRVSINKKNSYLLNNNRELYRIYRNKLTSLIRLSKKNYYYNYFESNLNNAKQTWKGINELISKNKNKQRTIRCLKSNNVNGLTFDPKDMSNIMNRYFAEIGSKLANNIPSTNNSITDYLGRPINNAFSFLPIIPEEIYDEINTLSNNKASGLYSCPIKLLKLGVTLLGEPLTILLNKSIETGTYPNKLKIAKVIPIYKADDESSPENYRPISLLSICNRIFEKLIYNRLINFIEKFDLLCDSQYGFRCNHSTQHAIIDITQKIQQNMDQGKYTCGIFIDLKKAFDTVDHNILLSKLNHYGIRGIFHDWFKSYLSNRKQTVCLDGIISEKESTSCGVPQGSVLGPLLFLIYINDIQNSSSVFSFHLFADDTSILFEHKNLQHLQNMVNQELLKLCDWLRTNKLSLNVKKTNFVMFRPRQKQLPFVPKIRLIDNSNNPFELESKDCMKYLGILIDSHMSWNQHINYISQKISRTVGIIAKLRHYVPRGTLLNIMKSFIDPYITYGICSWGQCAKKNLNRLLILQKRALRLINFSKSREHAVPFFIQARTLPLSFLYFERMCIMLHDIYNNNAPTNLNKLFKLSSESHHYETRSTSNQCFYVESINTETMRHSFVFSGSKIWNGLPTSLKKLRKAQFKTKIKNTLFNILKVADDYIDFAQILNFIE